MKIAKSFAAFGLAAALSGSLGASTLDFYYEPQQHSNWCWVATAKNLLVHYGVNQPQCDLANIALVRRDACGSGPYNWQHPANVTGAMFGYPRGSTYCCSNWVVAARRATKVPWAGMALPPISTKNAHWWPSGPTQAPTSPIWSRSTAMTKKMANDTWTISIRFLAKAVNTLATTG